MAFGSVVRAARRALMLRGVGFGGVEDREGVVWGWGRAVTAPMARAAMMVWRSEGIRGN